MNNNSSLSIVILAGGLGKRMKSEIPKVLHLLLDEPMLVHVLKTANKLNPNKIFIVVGKYKEIIKETIEKYISIENIVFVDQPEAQGTGHAMMCVRPYLLDHDTDAKVIVLSGDVPLLKSESIQSLDNTDLVTLMTTTYEDPKGYGRIIQDLEGQFVRIVEEKDCNEEEAAVNIVNAGVYSFNASILCKYLPLITNNNAQNEYYLTDIFELMITQENISIGMVHLPKHKGIELTGVNTKEQLEELENKLK